MRFMSFDQGVFQYQGLEFRVGDDDVEIVHLGRHGRHLGQMIAPEIAGDPVFQRFRLADVDHLAG